VNTIKNKLFVGLSLILAILLTTIVAAEISAGNTTVELDYGKLGEDDKRLEFSETITLTNTGSSAESGSLSLATLDGDFRGLEISSNTFELAAGTSKTITLSGEAPVNLDYDYDENFAKLTITTNTSSKEVNFKAEMAPMMEINKVYVYVNGNDEGSYDNGDTVDSIAPGDEVELRFILNNLYDRKYDKGDISGTIEADLSDLDIDNQEVDFDLEAGDEFGNSDAPRLNFTLPIDIDEDEYTIPVTFKDLESAAGAQFEDVEDWEIVLKIEKENDMVRLSELKVNPGSIDCFRRVDITGKLTNVGSDNQRYAAVVISSTYLGIDKRFDYSLNEGKSQAFTYTVDLNPNLKVDLYPIKVVGYIDSTTAKDSQVLELQVKDCASSKPVVNTTTQNANTTVKPNTTNTNTTTGVITQVSSSNIVKTVEKSYTKEDYLAGIMLVGLVLAVILIVVFGIILLK
jgi:hypothetical protein